MSKSEKIANICFYIALTIELILVILERSIYIIQYSGQWFRLTFALFVIKVIFTKYTRKEMIAIGTFCILGVISYLCTGANEVLRFVIMIVACKDINHDKMFKWIFVVWAIGVGTCILLSFFGIGIFKLDADFRGTGVETRYTLGLGHPNTLHGMIWITVTALLYAFRDRMKPIYLAVIEILNLGLFTLTTSRAGFLLISVLIVLAFLFQKWKKLFDAKWVNAAFGGVIIFAFLFTVISMYPPVYQLLMKQIDGVITGRIIYTFFNSPECVTWEMLPFSAMGRNPATDMGYAKLIAWIGYIPTIIYFVMCYFLFTTLKKRRDYIGASVLIAAFLSAIAESHIICIYIATNFIAFLLGKYWCEIIGGNGESIYLWDLVRRSNKLSTNV